jgi:hypothetical protein
MLQTVQCPHCGRKLAIDSQHAGKAVVCPMCKESFTPPAEDVLPIASPEADEGIQRNEPARPGPVISTFSGRDFADRVGIDPTEQHEEQVPGKTQAKRRLDEWHEEMPEVPSAYQPSGKMPTGGLIALIFGSVVGGIGGALAFLVVVGITLALTLGLAALMGWMAETCGRVLCILVILAIAIAVIGAGVSYGVLGWASAAITTGAGMIGKNRNTTAAVVFSIVSAILALAASHFTLTWMGGWLLEMLDLAGETWVNWVFLGSEGLGSVIALLVAAFSGRSMIHESKFCEECEEYMEEEKKRGLHLGATKAVVQALREGEFDAAADLMDSPEGKCGVPTLYWCAKCNQGYLEVQAKFKCTWTKGDDNEDLEEDWLAASAALDPDAVDRFRERRRKSRG